MYYQDLLDKFPSSTFKVYCKSNTALRQERTISAVSLFFQPLKLLLFKILTCFLDDNRRES